MACGSCGGAASTSTSSTAAAASTSSTSTAGAYEWEVTYTNGQRQRFPTEMEATAALSKTGGGMQQVPKA